MQGGRGEKNLKIKNLSRATKEFSAKSGASCSTGSSGEFLVDNIHVHILSADRLHLSFDDMSNKKLF